MNKDDLLGHFRGVMAGADGTWTAFCSAHPDGAKHGNRSLSLAYRDTKWLLHCYNGCPAESITASAGLSMADLFDAPPAAGFRPRMVAGGRRRPLSQKQIDEWWVAAKPIRGTLAEVYLRSRAIELDYEFPSLRYLSAAPYWSGRENKAGRENPKTKIKAYYPCLVAAIANLSGDIVGLHRTYLSPDGLSKAPEEPNRKMWGDVKPGVRLSPPSGGLVRIAEGIETILSVATAKGLGEAQYVAALAAVDLSNWEGPPFETLEIYADNDANGVGKKAADELALRVKVKERRAVIFLPPEVGEDFNDILWKRGAATVCEVEGQERAEATPEEKKTAARPLIDVSSYGLEGLAKEAWAALEQYNNPPRVFKGYHGLVRVNSEPVPLDHYGLRHVLARAARWEKGTMHGSVQTAVPLDICHDMLSDPRPAVPSLNRVASHWIIDSAGRFLTEPGYDQDSGIYVSISEPFEPKEMSVEEAILLFDNLLCDFKWAQDSDRAHALALMILPFVREYIRGETPIHLVEAPNPGTGKGLLARVLLSVAGVAKSFLAATKNVDEFHKRLEGLLLNYREAVVIDNMVEDFNSETVASMITAPALDVRPYYTQTPIPVKQRLIWAGTVNNPQLSEELARRALRIRIVSPIELPYLREDLRDDELAWTFEKRRHETMSAIWAIVKAWDKAGRPEKTVKLGSFVHWAKVIGGILEVAQIGHFLERQPEDVGTPARAALANFIADWFANHGDEEHKASELVRLAQLHNIFLGKSEKPEQQAWHLSRTLNSSRDQIFGQFRIKSHNTKDGLKFKLVSAIAQEDLPF